jgi:GT2 family glycosyltransferase
VVEAVRSLVELGGHDDTEIIVVHDAGTPARALDRLREVAGRQLRLVPYDKPFDFSEKCNLGVLHAHGEVVVLLNDDTEVASPDFLVQLVAPLFEEGVGMTGARLLFPDGRVQHGGLALDRRLDHVLDGGRTKDLGQFLVRETAAYRVGSALVVNREVSGASAACLAMRKSLYEELGGLSEQFPEHFGDVDLSLKVRSAGYRILWMAEPTAYHFESRSREGWVLPREVRLLNRRWFLPAIDPYLPGLPESRPVPRSRDRAQRQATRKAPRPQTPSSTSAGPP